MDRAPPELIGPDGVALVWFLLTWLGYGPLIQVWSHPSGVNVRLHEVRRVWMRVMLARDNRIVDTSLIGHTVHSATFFASTTMVALAALIGILGNFERSFAALGDLTFAAQTSPALAEMKVVLLVFVFAHSFLKLTWALRKLNYCIALIGAAPLEPDPARSGAIADRIATVFSLAIGSFNAGLRDYYFALAALVWLLGPGAFALATSGIVAMMLWHQFGSTTAKGIRLGQAAYAAADLDAEGRAAGAGLQASAKAVPAAGHGLGHSDAA